MDKKLSVWNEIFLNCGQEKPIYDDWLDKFKHILDLSNNIPIIDLGCGFGNDTLYLTERGFKVISCDYSIEALKRLKYFIKEPVVRLFNFRDGLPFESNSARIIIADLSLHYFSTKETTDIICDISRVLVPEGYLICRVNSVKDVNHGAGQGIKIEDNFYNFEGGFKRFFDKYQIESFFDNWSIEYVNECEMNRYKEKKIVWEVIVKSQKPKANNQKPIANSQQP